MDSETEIEQQACKFEHILSPEATDKICAFLGHPRTCPHGAPIPPGPCCAAVPERSGFSQFTCSGRPLPRINANHACPPEHVGDKRRGRPPFCYSIYPGVGPMTSRRSPHRGFRLRLWRTHRSESLTGTVPDADYVYFGDTARLPYGSKSVETVARYAVEAAHFLDPGRGNAGDRLQFCNGSGSGPDQSAAHVPVVA